MEQYGQFGYNADGELGDGTTEHKTSFVQVLNENGTAPLNNIKSIATGHATSYAISNNGDLYAWGYNNYGQIGSKDATSRRLPYKTELTNIKQVVGGECFTLALSNDGTVYGTGRNSEGQLGIRNSGDTNLWQKMKEIDETSELTGVKQIAVGRYHSLILKNDGTVYSTGYNGYGELGKGTEGSVNRLVEVKKADGSKITNGKIIAAGWHESAIITEDRRTIHRTDTMHIHNLELETQEINIVSQK